MNHIIASLLLVASASAFAQTPAQVEVDPSLAIPAQGELISLPPHIAAGISQEDYRAAHAVGSAAVKDILEAYRTKATPADFDLANKTRTRMDSIANEVMEADRQAVMRFLGIDPDAETGLYIFASWSMPLEMLRSYAIEAMWSGATMVFRGVPPGKELFTFLTEDLRQLVYSKGAAANISIDPRLFDVYKVTTVPTVVFSKVRKDLQCQGVERIPMTFQNGKDGAYDKCPPLADDEYWKISGAVTTNYALQAFLDDGADTAKPYMAALARGFAEGKVPGKAQRAFTGEWKDVLSPSEQLAAKEASAMMLSAPPQAGPTSPIQ